MNSGNPLSQNSFKVQKPDFIDDTMKIDLMKLHVPEEDTNIRRCLRIYTILPRFCDHPNKRNEKAEEIMQDIWEVGKKMKKKFGAKWRSLWAETIPYEVSYSAIKDWMIGRASIPLIAIDSLRELGFEKEADSILNKTEYIASTTGDITKIPKRVDRDIVYLAGLILGDGSLPITRKNNNYDYRINITSGDLKFLDKIRKLIRDIFEIETPKAVYRFHGGASWEFYKRNKALYRLFTKVIGITNGDKAKNGKIPYFVKQLESSQKIAFIAGLIDSDLGKHSRSIGGTFKSKQLVDDLIEFMNELGITAKSYGSHYKSGIYLQHDFTILKSQVKELKALLVANYLPKKEDRLNAINIISQG